MHVCTNVHMYYVHTYIYAHSCIALCVCICVCMHTLAHILNLLACVPARGKGRATTTTMRCYSTRRNERRANCRSGRERGWERWGEKTRCGTGATVGATDVNVIKEIIVTMSAAAAAASPSSSQWRHQYKLISDRHEQRQQQQYNNNSASSSRSSNNNNDTIDRRDGRWVVVRSVVLSAGLTSWRINNLRWIKKKREGQREQERQSKCTRERREREFCQYTHTHGRYFCVYVCLFAAVCSHVCVCWGEPTHFRILLKIQQV